MKNALFVILLLAPVLLSAQLNWTIQDVSFSTGDTVHAEFSVYDFDSISAYQMAMRFDTGALVFLGVAFPDDNPLDLSVPNEFGFYQVNKGILRHLWSDIWSRTLDDGTHVFTYSFRAKQSGSLSADLWLATCCLNPPMNPMAYRYPLQYMPLTVVYVNQGAIVSTEENTDEMQVKVYPNPATDVLIVESPDVVNVEIYNIAGQRTHCATGQRIEFTGLQKGFAHVYINNKHSKTIAIP